MWLKSGFLPFIFLLQCTSPDPVAPAKREVQANPSAPAAMPVNKEAKIIHLFVALCDNKNQGIVPVPPKIGNGQDPANNLYWGCSYGVKSWFRSQPAWQLKWSGTGTNSMVLERLVFKHRSSNTWLIADAYDGALIKNCTETFLQAAAGGGADSVRVDGQTLWAGGSSNLLAYIGHDGLMEFSLDKFAEKKNDQLRETIILACYSKRYFSPYISRTGARPLLWTSGLMAPEAYTLSAAIEGWIQKESPEQIRERAAAAYSRYQKCSLKAARNLMVN